jgi:MATE family multidrug resistance protein
VLRKLKSLEHEVGPMLRLAIPLVLAELGWMSMGIVDTMMVGRLPQSAIAIGAVSLGGILFYPFGIFGSGLLLGLDTLVSQSFGAGRLKECHQSLLDGVYISLALSPVMMGVIWIGIPWLPAAGIQPAVLKEAVPYLRILNWSMLPLMLYFGSRRYLQGMNLVKPVTFALISANLVNLAGNWILIYGRLGAPRMGVRGSAVATCASRVYMAAVLLGYIAWYEHRRKTGLRHTSPRPKWDRIGKLLRLGFPAAAQLALEVGAFSAATALIARLDAVSLAAHQVALYTASFTFMVPLGISSAAAVRVGHALGRRDVRAASHSGWMALALGAGFMSLAAAAFLLFPRHIARIYTPNAAIIQMSSSLLGVAAFFQLFDGLQVVATGALRGTGDTHTAMIGNFVAYWLLGLPLGAYLCFRFGWGAFGMWIGLCLGLIFVGSLLLFVWHRRVKRLSLEMAKT